MTSTKKKFSGWAVFVGCLILMIFPGGMLSYTNGLFMYQICEEFGFSITAYSVSLTISTAVNAPVSAFLVGYLSKGSKKTMKAIMGISVIGVCLGFAGQSLCTQLWQFYLMAIVWSLGYNMITFVPVTMLMSNWFVQKRELLTGIVIAFSSVGGAIGNFVVPQVISGQGWRTAYILCGLISLVFCLSAVLFLIKRSPGEYGQEAYGAEEKAQEEKRAVTVWRGITKKEAMKHPALYMLCAAMFLTGLYATGVTSHAVTYFCTSGWDITAAGGVMTVFTLAGIVGSSVGGALLGRLGYRKGVLLGGALLILAMACLILGSQNHALAYLFAILLGFGCYMGILLPSQSVMNTFGGKDYAGIYGLTNSFYLIGCGVAAPAVAMISESAGYVWAWASVVAMIFVIVVLHMRCINAGEKIRIKNPE